MGRSDRNNGLLFRRNSATQTSECFHVPLNTLDKSDQATMTMEETEITVDELPQSPKPAATETGNKPPLRSSVRDNVSDIHFQQEQSIPYHYQQMPPFHPTPHLRSKFYPPPFQVDRGNPSINIPEPLYDFWNHDPRYFQSEPRFSYPEMAAFPQHSYATRQYEPSQSVVEVVEECKDKVYKRIEKQVGQLSRICASVIKNRDRRAELRDSLAIQLRGIQEQSAVIAQLKINDIRERSRQMYLTREQRPERQPPPILPDRFDTSRLRSSRPFSSSNGRMRRSRKSANSSEATTSSSEESNDEQVEAGSQKSKLYGSTDVRRKVSSLPKKSILEWRASLMTFNYSLEKLLYRLFASGFCDADCTHDLLKIRENTITKLQDVDEVLELLE